MLTVGHCKGIQSVYKSHCKQFSKVLSVGARPNVVKQVVVVPALHFSLCRIFMSRIFSRPIRLLMIKEISYSKELNKLS